eukprot:974670-Rhodomonas_salina.1
MGLREGRWSPSIAENCSSCAQNWHAEGMFSSFSRRTGHPGGFGFFPSRNSYPGTGTWSHKQKPTYPYKVLGKENLACAASFLRIS